jgi:hypothetical protein
VVGGGSVTTGAVVVVAGCVGAGVCATVGAGRAGAEVVATVGATVVVGIVDEVVVV